VRSIHQKLKEDVAVVQAENKGFKPGVAIVQLKHNQ